MTFRQSLIHALMGTDNLDNCPSTWSPNLVKAIFISRSCIVIAFHGRSPKYVAVDESEAVAFIQSNGGKGRLQNVLARRTLSCLEEIYVDSIFKQYLGALDLVGYVNNLQSDICRLRYWGFFQYCDLSGIYERYNNASINGLKNYTFALDETRGNISSFEIQNTNNDEWFRKYNLRPNEYPSIDKEGGNLHAWFKLVEKDMEKEYEQKRAIAESSTKASAYKALIANDCSYCLYYSYLKKLSYIIQNGLCPYTRAAKVVAEVCNKASSLDVNVRISKGDFIEALKSLGYQPSDDRVKVLRSELIKSKALIDDESSLVSLEDLNRVMESSGSILNYRRAFSSIVNQVFSSGIQSCKLLLVVESNSGSFGELVGCRDIESIKAKLLDMCHDGSLMNIKEVTEYLLAISGFTTMGIDGVIAMEQSKGREEM